MTAYEATRKWGISPSQLSKWCKNGKVEAVRVKFGNRWKWIIPDDHPQPVPQTNGLPSVAREKAVLRKHGKRGYIAKFAGTFSVRHMAQFLETTCAEVRTTYDDIVARGGF
jgi:hypothetical protein